MSNFFRKRRPTASGTGIGPSSCTNLGYYRDPNLITSTAKKQRLIDATKMVLDIAKESADAFPPLKSCLGGINALIKHYDVRVYIELFLGATDRFIPGMRGRQR